MSRGAAVGVSTYSSRRKDIQSVASRAGNRTDRRGGQDRKLTARTARGTKTSQRRVQVGPSGGERLESSRSVVAGSPDRGREVMTRNRRRPGQVVGPGSVWSPLKPYPDDKGFEWPSGRGVEKGTPPYTGTRRPPRRRDEEFHGTLQCEDYVHVLNVSRKQVSE